MTSGSLAAEEEAAPEAPAPLEPGLGMMVMSLGILRPDAPLNGAGEPPLEGGPLPPDLPFLEPLQRGKGKEEGDQLRRNGLG